MAKSIHRAIKRGERYGDTGSLRWSAWLTGSAWEQHFGTWRASQTEAERQGAKDRLALSQHGTFRHAVIAKEEK